MKPQPGSKYLKMSDKDMKLVDKTIGINVVQKHACILMYERDEDCTIHSVSDKSSEFAFSELVNEFESEIRSTPRASHKRKTRSSSHDRDQTPAKSRKLSHSEKNSTGILPFLEETKKSSGTHISSPPNSPFEESLEENSTDDKDEIQSGSGSDSDSEYMKNCVFLTTPRGLQEYTILDDDSTVFEQKCVYCLESTTQFFGKVTYICETCGYLASTTSKLNTKQLEKDIEQIGVPNLYDHCVGCKTKFCDKDIHDYHKLGELKYCVECISTNACKCFICIKGTDHMYSDRVNNLRGMYLFKVSRLNSKSSSFIAKVVNTFLESDRTDNESFLCENIQSHGGEYIVNHGGQLLLNKLFQKYFYTSKESPMSWEIVQYYANLCRDSTIAKKNGVIVWYTNSDPNKQIEDLLKKPRNGIHLFVGKSGDDKWHGYEVNFTKKDEVKIVYFDTSETNRENNPFISASVNSFFKSTKNCCGRWRVEIHKWWVQGRSKFLSP